MYSLESIGKHDGSWAESVDLTRFVAADNELEMIDESVFPDVDPEELAEDEDAQGSIFAGLETLDLHGNVLISLPAGLRRLTLLTSLNLVIALRDVKLGGNLFWGTLEPCFGRLVNLEILDLHGNSLQALPPSFAELHRLRILNVSENSFESLPFDVLSKLPLTELNARKNKLTGTLIDEGVEVLPALQNLDVSSNQLTSLARPNAVLAMPALSQLCVSMNRLQALPDVTSWFELINLAADENNIKAFPDGFTSLHKLRSADFSSNDIRTVPAEIAHMNNLNMLRLSGNPLRDKKFVSATIEELKDALSARIAPPADSDDFFVDSLTTLSLAHNQLVGESYLNVGEGLDLPSLKELDLSSNHITGLAPLVNRLQAPSLEKLDVSVNRLASIPSSSDREKGGKLLRDVFPNLTVLLIANNHLADLDPESIRGVKVVDASNNDIAHLNPRIGLLGGAGGLEKLIVTGNRFRVPRWNVLDRGTDATLRFLRGRVPVADMAAWRAEKGMPADEEVSDVD
ncbi:putative leucine rich repeat family protein [Diaporthe ampelina]|uniref:Putative leucine rich repeat family protein n=1 Tax=Diaporthe ampelina TaxID=1214573 RepID=A0A0G2FUY5_9PEZI|nr:putative leucine rich repeat family protein [Diaporthe ampelina]